MSGLAIIVAGDVIGWRRIDLQLKNFPLTLAAHMAGLPKNTQVEIWFQDETMLGQKNARTRIWAKKAPRPRLPAACRLYLTRP